MQPNVTVAIAVVLAGWSGVESSGQEVVGLKPRLEAVKRAQAEAHHRFAEELKGKATEAEQAPAFARYREEAGRNADEVLDLVQTHPSDPAAVESLQFVIETARGGPRDQSIRAMEILLRDHARDPGLGLLCGKLFVFSHSRVAEALVRAVAEKHPSREERGLACHALAWLLDYRAAMVRAVRQGTRTVDGYVDERFQEATRRLIAESDPDALGRESDALLERVIADYADVKDWYTPNRTLGAIAEGERFARRSLSPGLVAPEIAGKDHEGKPFALSDYRGKVVVLTFSASWCGPCVGMYPHERGLVKKLEGRPFALLSVNEDEDVATLQKAIASGEITWRCWWDGGLDGPITTRWGVAAIPEVVVLDRAGVIRQKNVRGADLEKAVMVLLEEKTASEVAPK